MHGSDFLLDYRICSEFFGFHSDFGLVSSNIVRDTRAVFPKAGVRDQDLYYAPILIICGRIRGPDFLSDFRIFGFLDCSSIFRSIELRNRSVHPRDVPEGASESLGLALWTDSGNLCVEFVGRNFGAFDGFPFYSFWYL